MREMRQRVARALELPSDLVLDLARLSLVGDLELLVENHRGLAEYHPAQVIFHTPAGRIAVAGEHLEIGSISPDSISILGKIRSIIYLD